LLLAKETVCWRRIIDQRFLEMFGKLSWHKFYVALNSEIFMVELNKLQ